MVLVAFVLGGVCPHAKYSPCCTIRTSVCFFVHEQSASALSCFCANRKMKGNSTHVRTHEYVRRPFYFRFISLLFEFLRFLIFFSFVHLSASLFFLFFVWSACFHSPSLVPFPHKHSNWHSHCFISFFYIFVLCDSNFEQRFLRPSLVFFLAPSLLPGRRRYTLRRLCGEEILLPSASCTRSSCPPAATWVLKLNPF